MTDPAAALDPASLRGLSEEALDERLRAFANAHGADALPALTGLAETASERGVRRATFANRAVQVPNDLDEIIKAIEVYS